MEAIKTIQELLGKINSSQSGKGYEALAEIEAEVKRLRMNKITDAKDLIVGEYPIGFITHESIARLSDGGNCKGSVPIHQTPSYAASTPVYLGSHQGLAEVTKSQDMIIGELYYIEYNSGRIASYICSKKTLEYLDSGLISVAYGPIPRPTEE